MIIRKLFSINYENFKYVIYILGIKITVKDKKDAYLYNSIEQIKEVLSNPYRIWTRCAIKFYLPNYPIDEIQRFIFERRNFYENDILHKIDKYIPKNAVIFDIGANIGNHTLYWATQRNSR